MIFPILGVRVCHARFCHARAGSLTLEGKNEVPSPVAVFLRDNYSPFFARQKKRIFLFFLWGRPVQNRPQNPALASCLLSTRKSRSEVPEEGILGNKIAWGRMGWPGQKKGKKDAQKEVGLS